MPVQSSVVVHSLLGDTPNWKRCPHLLFFFRLSASICSLDFLMNIYKNSCNIECFHLFNFYVFFFSSVYLPSKKKKNPKSLSKIRSHSTFSASFFLDFHFIFHRWVEQQQQEERKKNVARTNSTLLPFPLCRVTYMTRIFKRKFF